MSRWATLYRLSQPDDDDGQTLNPKKNSKRIRTFHAETLGSESQGHISKSTHTTTAGGCRGGGRGQPRHRVLRGGDSLQARYPCILISEVPLYSVFHISEVPLYRKRSGRRRHGGCRCLRFRGPREGHCVRTARMAPEVGSSLQGCLAHKKHPPLQEEVGAADGGNLSGRGKENAKKIAWRYSLTSLIRNSSPLGLP